MPGGRLLGAETQRNIICRISGLKSGSSRGEIQLAVACESVYKYILLVWEAKRLSAKWSRTGGGRLREVVAMRVLTVFEIPINEQK